jgi:hypothetical protein
VIDPRCQFVRKPQDLSHFPKWQQSNIGTGAFGHSERRQALPTSSLALRRSISNELFYTVEQLCFVNRWEFCMSFAIYMIGLLLLIGGIGWALLTAGIAQLYIGIALLIIAGLGVMMAVTRTRAKDPPA